MFLSGASLLNGLSKLEKADISDDKKIGAITLKKGLKKGSYVLKVAVQAKKAASYAAAAATFTLKIKVKQARGQGKVATSVSLNA